MRFGEFQKFRRHHGADSMTADVLRPGIAAAIPIEPGHWFDGADLKRLAKYVTSGVPSPPSVISIVPQHYSLLVG
jgi:hypothetical protein